MLSSKIFLLLVVYIGVSISVSAQSVSVIPVPKQMTVTGNKTSFTHLRYWVNDGAIQPAVHAFKENLSRLSFATVTESSTEQAADMQIAITKTLAEKEYSIIIKKKILVKAGSYQAVTWAMASLLQMVVVKSNVLLWSQVSITDQPDNVYRGLLLDVARNWHEAATIRTIIDICGYYKIPYLQLHLSDDQSFTFPSKAFPALATPGRHYAEQELKELVSYAYGRGVVIVPEMDLPGHSTAMRRAMPELFGDPDLRVIDLNKPEVHEAVKILTREMAAVFYTSPYIHIGADECNFDLFEKLPATRKTIAQKGFSNVHDLLLEYILEMNTYVKSLGKKTLAWESFKGKGTPYLTVPNDILIFGWETLYQRPDSLLNNGYTIMNASWKPLYITPGYRWGPRYIYNDWNISKWQNWWDAAPSYHTIQLPDDNRIIGAQYCSWEMDDYMEVSEILARMPAFSEKIWNKKSTVAYDAFEQRGNILNTKLAQVMFSSTITVEGVVKPVEHEIKFLENNFTDSVKIIVNNLPKNYFITFTTDGKKPQAQSTPWTKTLVFDSSVNLQISIFNAAKKETGYYHNRFKKIPLAFSVNGNYGLPVNVNVMNAPSIIIKNPVIVKILYNKGKEGLVRYKINQKDKPGELQRYDAKGIKIDASCDVEAYIADDTGKLIERSLLQVRTGN
ncbi:MAG: family 20 glycosylhydrolase [Agriterribacter sp.]